MTSILLSLYCCLKLKQNIVRKLDRITNENKRKPDNFNLPTNYRRGPKNKCDGDIRNLPENETFGSETVKFEAFRAENVRQEAVRYEAFKDRLGKFDEIKEEIKTL